MKYFFVLGSNPSLSIAEIAAVLGMRAANFGLSSSQVLVVESGAGLDPVALMGRLGGTVKIGVMMEMPHGPAAEAAADLMTEKLLSRGATGQRITFGYSVYRLDGSARHAAAELRNAGMETKTRLKEASAGARWVKAQDGYALSSVAVAKNRLIEEGAEFVFLATADGLLAGMTSAVQPFEEFSGTDYGRPARDTLQGMLPPKLARMMINIAAVPADKRLLDPFCGSGTVLTEALRLGFTDVAGSDLNPEAVKSTLANIDWLKGRGGLPASKVEVFASDARKLSGRFPESSIGAVVTEPFLGAPRRGRETRGELQRQLAELSRLYYESLSSWGHLLRPDACVVIALPVFILGREKHGVSVSEFSKLGWRPAALLPGTAPAGYKTSLTKNGGLLYGRPDQLVWREIVRLVRQ